MKRTDISLGIIEDDTAVMNGLKSYLESQPTFSKCIGAGSVEQFFEITAGPGLPDIVLIDIGLPGVSGIEGIKLIKEKNPATEIIMITVFKDADRIFRSLCMGASGYLLKGAPFQEIKQSILTIAEGGSYMSPSIARKVIGYFHPEQAGKEQFLTSKEIQIVEGLVEGKTYKMLAYHFGIALDTVRYHIRNIYRKLEVNSKSEVVAKSLKGEIPGFRNPKSPPQKGGDTTE